MTRGSLWLPALLALCGLVACSADPAELAAQCQAKLATDDTAAAEIHARQWVSQAPESPQARAMLARVLVARQNLKDAADEASRALRLGLPADDYAPVQAEILLAQGRMDALLALADKHRPTQPAALAELHLARARAMAALERPAEARAEVTRAIELAPQLLSVREMGIRMRAGEGQTAEALRLADQLAQEQPNAATSWALLGDLLLQAGSLERAEQAYRKALSLRPRLLNAHAGLVQIQERLNNPEALRSQLAAMDSALPHHPTTHFLHAQAAFAQGRWQLARTRLQALVYRQGVPAEVLYLAGMVELQAENLVAANDLLSRAVVQRPGASPARLALAGLHLQAGRLDEAQVQLKAVQAAEPQNHLAWALQGEAQVRAREFRKADQSFARALQLRPQDPAVRMAVARGLVARGDRAAALALLSEMAQLEGAGLESGLQWSWLLAQSGDINGAKKALDLVAQRHPQSPAPDMARASLHLAHEDLAAARSALTRALTLDPANVEATQGLATLHTASGDVAAAMKVYRELLVRNPRASNAMLKLAELTPLAGGSRAKALEWMDMAVSVSPTDAAIWSQTITMQLNMGDVPGAAARAQAATQALPSHAGLQLLLASVRQQTGEPAQASQALGRAAQLAPQSTQPLVQLALAELAAGRTEQSRQLLARAASLSAHDEDTIRAELQWTVATAKSQDRGPAQALLRRQQHKRPQRALGWQLQGEWEAQQQRHAEAAAAFELALAKEPSPLVARQFNAALHASGQGERAARFQAEWERGHPADAAFLSHAAELAMGAGDATQASALLERAVKLQPMHAVAANNLAAARLATRHADALPSAWRAVALTPSSPHALDTLAQAQDAAGQTDKAIATQYAIVQIQPRDTAVRMKLAELLLKAKSVDEAKKELRWVAKEGTSDQQRQAAQKALSHLGG